MTPLAPAARPMTPEDELADGVLPVARQLGEKLELDAIPVLEPITTNLFRCRRRDLWSPEALAEMERIWNGEDA